MSSLPLVWYMAQGYPIAGGIEAHIYHYACELRRHGFRTKVVVPNELPRQEHRFMKLLREQCIPLESIADENAGRIRFAALATYLPWRARNRQVPEWSLARHQVYVSERLLPSNLRRKLERESPAIIHVFGRMGDNVWPVLPPERTILHHMTVGKLDESWLPAEVEHFRTFAEKAARYFAPGSGVAENIRREFGVQRHIEAVYTMAPDGEGDHGLRTTDHGLQTTDGRPETGDRRPETADHRLQTEDCRQETADREPQIAGYRLLVSGKEANEPTVPAPSSLPNSQQPTTKNPKPPLRFGILCRMTDEKGIRYIFDALLGFRARHGDVRFVFAGSGYLADAIRAFIKDNGLANVRYDETFSCPAAVMREIDVFVHPSVTDAMPMAIVEALMCGKPCIGTRVGGIADLVRDGVEGRIIEPHSAEQILEATEFFAGIGEEALRGFSERARKRYEEVCRPESVGKVVAEQYRAIAGDGRP